MAMIEMDHREELIIVYGMVNCVIIPYRKEGREIGVGRFRRFLETRTVNVTRTFKYEASC